MKMRQKREARFDMLAAMARAILVRNVRQRDSAIMNPGGLVQDLQRVATGGKGRNQSAVDRSN